MLRSIQSNTHRRGSLLFYAWRRASKRDGISLIEILVSIGVISVGLMSVVLLIPIAQHKAERGAQADRAAIAGRRAVRDFSIQGLDKFENWYSEAMSQVYLQSNGLWANPSNEQFRYLSFCYDPLYLTQVGTNNRWYFPYGTQFDTGTTAQPMFRISRSLFPNPFAQQSSWWISGVQNPWSSQAWPQRTSYTDPFILNQDDLTFDQDNENRIPLQTVLRDSNQGIAKRFANGHYSWMATMVPQHHIDSDLYRLSIVVFHKRQIVNPEVNQIDSEHTVDVTQLYSGGIAGGDMWVTAIDDREFGRDDQHLVDLRAGDWVLLSGLKVMFDQNSASNPNIPVRTYRWYRVTAVDDPELVPNNAATSTGPAQREITLQGQDWDINAANTQMILVRDVVGVYERMVRIGLD